MTENKRFERIYADVDVFCRDHNAKGISQLIEKEDYDKIVDLLNHLHEENEELKQLIKEVLKLLEEEVDLFSDEATEHDIKAYVELIEFDNKDAYYMAISTKKAIKLLKEVIE